MNHHLITIDVDWAPDAVIRDCAGLLIDGGVKATWLVTHDSEAVRELGGRDDLFELGIHPNFHAGSTQGDTPERVLRHLLDIVPGARTVRTHDLFQSTRLLRMMVGEFGIENDLSLLLPGAANIAPHEFHLPEGVLRRFPTFWEDDAEMLQPRPGFELSDPRFHVEGLKVFTFHPILLALNAASLDSYRRLKSSHDIARLTTEQIAPHVNRDGPGDATLFAELVDHIGSSGAGLTVSELAETWIAGRADES